MRYTIERIVLDFSWFANPINTFWVTYAIVGIYITLAMAISDYKYSDMDNDEMMIFPILAFFMALGWPLLLYMNFKNTDQKVARLEDEVTELQRELNYKSGYNNTLQAKLDKLENENEDPEADKDE